MFENDYTIYGTHATKLKCMAKGGNNAPYIYDRYIDVLLNAAVFGIYYNRRANRDTTSSDRARVYSDAIQRERQKCILVYRLIMLLDQSVAISAEEKIDRAFRYDTLEDKSQYMENMKLFDSYVLGGIDVMYDLLVEGKTNQREINDGILEVIKQSLNLHSRNEVQEEIKELLKS